MAVNEKLEIDTMRLQGDIDDLRSHLRRMEQQGEEMMGGINALSQMWEGPAKAAFTVQFQADYETLQSMGQVLDTLIKSLEFAKENYITCESNVSSIISSIRI